MTRMYWIRHGQTEWNAIGRWQGNIDVPLADVGHEQARSLAEYVKDVPFAALYSSDLSRAAQTAEAIARVTGLPVIQDVRLREMHLGVFQGHTHDEHMQKFPDLVKANELDFWGFRFPEGETRRDVQDRVYAFYQDALARHPDQTIAVVTHGGPVRMILYKLFGETDEYRSLKVTNTSITVIAQEGQDAPVLESVVGTHHLEKKPIDPKSL
jgi:broad specificity phosphatase PhoE